MHLSNVDLCQAIVVRMHNRTESLNLCKSGTPPLNPALYFRMKKMNTSQDDQLGIDFPYKLHGKETKLLADLSGIDKDLNSTIQLCRTILKLMMENEEMDLFLIDALTTAALIKYSRCFTKAARNKIPKEYMDSLPKNLKEKHTYFINFRNKYIAN